MVVIFGGEGNSEGTQVYDPFTNMWHRMNPKTQPEPRSGGNMAYDALSKRHILFGTQFGEDRRTWAYDLRKNEWMDRKPKSQPPTDRNDPVLAWDANARKVIAVVRVVDRSEKTEVQAGHVETWAYDFDSNAWYEMKPNREPDGHRSYFAMCEARDVARIIGHLTDRDWAEVQVRLGIALAT